MTLSFRLNAQHLSDGMSGGSESDMNHQLTNQRDCLQIDQFN